MDKACILCDSRLHKNTIWGGYRFQKKIYSIARCSNCGFMFLDPVPCDDILNDIYQGDDFFENYYAAQSGVISYTDGMAGSKNKIKDILKLIGRHKKTGRLFDIGCAAGMFLVDARDAGYEVSGVEPSRQMAKYARDSFGLNITCADLKDLDCKDGYFDIIHVGDVLEHMPGLQENIEIIRKLLGNNGIFVVEQPLTYNRSLFNLFLRLKMFFSRDKYSVNAPVHLWEFNAATLKKFLEKNNFKVIYYKVFEETAKPLAVYKNPGMKNLIGHYIKYISCFISNNFLFKKLLLGDRATVICIKKTRK